MALQTEQLQQHGEGRRGQHLQQQKARAATKGPRRDAGKGTFEAAQQQELEEAMAAVSQLRYERAMLQKELRCLQDRAGQQVGARGPRGHAVLVSYGIGSANRKCVLEIRTGCCMSTYRRCFSHMIFTLTSRCTVGLTVFRPLRRTSLLLVVSRMDPAALMFPHVTPRAMPLPPRRCDAAREAESATWSGKGITCRTS